MRARPKSAVEKLENGTFSIFYSLAVSFCLSSLSSFQEEK